MKIYLVRHGETLFNTRGQLQGWCDSPLTELGRRQANALAEHLRSIPLDRALTSDLTRARETARAALRYHPDLLLEESTDLREWHFGGFEALPNAHMWGPVYNSLGATYGDHDSQMAARRNGVTPLIDAIAAADATGEAESSIDVNRRVHDAITMILARPADHILVVTHGAVIANFVEALVPGSQPKPGFPNGAVRTIDLSLLEDDRLSDVVIPRLER